MSGYPIELITSYSAGKISRQQFTKQFSDWQKSRGINYDCKGTADERGVHVEYRGTTATIRDGKLSFITGDNCEPDSPTHFLWHEANSVFEFRRKVDFSRPVACDYFNRVSAHSASPFSLIAFSKNSSLLYR